MNWFDIVKQPKLRTSSKITTRLGSESKPEEDDTCKRKLDEYEIKLKRMRDKIRGLNVFTFVFRHSKDSYSIENMPEEVACKALKILNGLKLDEPQVKEQMVVVGKKYEINSIYYSNRNPKDPLDDLLTMELKILMESIYGDLRTVLNFTVMFNGPKEEAMKKVDFR